MHIHLIESQHPVNWHAGEALFSAATHATVLAILLLLAPQAAQHFDAVRAESITFAQVKPDEPEPPPPEPAEAPPIDVTAGPPPPKGFQVLTAPVEIPNVIPDVDLTRAVTNEEDFSGKGVAGGVARGVVGGTGRVTEAVDQPYFEFQVEKPAIAAPGNAPPRYPEALQKASISGEVMAQFVVDTLGRADMSTFKILRSDNRLFEIAVRNVLPSHRFLPAEVGGRKVRMWVQQPFLFEIR